MQSTYKVVWFFSVLIFIKFQHKDCISVWLNENTSLYTNMPTELFQFCFNWALRWDYSWTNLPKNKKQSRNKPSDRDQIKWTWIPTVWLVEYSFNLYIDSFMQQIFSECSLCTGQWSRPWGYSEEHDIFWIFYMCRLSNYALLLCGTTT